MSSGTVSVDFSGTVYVFDTDGNRHVMSGRELQGTPTEDGCVVLPEGHRCRECHDQPEGKYVPVSKVQRIAESAETYAEIFPEDSQSRRLGLKIATDIHECVEENSLSESELDGDDG